MRKRRIRRRWRWITRRQYCGETHISASRMIISMVSVSFSGTLRDEWFHFGLCKDDSKDAFVWQNGEALTFSFWKAGGPDNYLNSQKCANLDPNAGYKWNDIFCNERNYGIQICEIVVL